MKPSHAKDVADYLENDLLQAIQNDLVDVLKFHEKKNISGFHSIPREVFCYIDYLGILLEGPPASSKKAITFIEKYMAKADTKYKQYGKILYEMWRHGTVHEFDPKVIMHSQHKYKMGWQTNNSSKPHNRSCHLECFKMQGTRNEYVLHINLFELVEHLIFASRSLISALKRDHHFYQRGQKYFTEISQPMVVNEFQRKALNLQITRAIKNQKREVSKDGKVVT